MQNHDQTPRQFEAPEWANLAQVYHKPSKTWHAITSVDELKTFIPEDATPPAVIHLSPPVCVSCPNVCLSCQTSLEASSDGSPVCVDQLTGVMKDGAAVSVHVTRRYCDLCWPSIRGRETIDRVGTYFGMTLAVIAVIAGLVIMVMNGFVLVWAPLVLLVAAAAYYINYYVLLGPMLYFYGLLKGVYSEKEVQAFFVNEGVELVCQNANVAREILESQLKKA